MVVERWNLRTSAVATTLLVHHPEVMLGVLVEVLCFDNLPASCRVLGHGGVTFVVVERVCHGLARIAGRANARRSRVALPLLILIALWPERPSSRTLVQGSLQF